MKICLPILLCLLLTSCAGGWTEEDKKQLRNDCVEQAKTQISAENTAKYCDCFVEQMVKTYPVFNDVMEHYKSDSVEKLKAHCRHEIGMQ
jgi:hypothetical protein